MDDQPGISVYNRKQSIEDKLGDNGHVPRQSMDDQPGISVYNLKQSIEDKHLDTGYDHRQINEDNTGLDHRQNIEDKHEYGCRNTEDISNESVARIDSMTTVRPVSTPVAGHKKHVMVGSVVWGKFSKNVWWPAVVLNDKLTRRTSREGRVWLYWFSDKQISQVMECHVEPFHTNFLCRSRQSGGKRMQAGIHLALEMCALRAKVDVTPYGGVDGWARADNGFLYTDRERFQPQAEYDVPDYVLEDLDIVPKSSNITCTKLQNDHTDDDDSSCQLVPIPSQEFLNRLEEDEASCATMREASNLTKIRDDRSTASEVKTCLACDTTYELITDHPLFEGKICRKCKDVLKSSFYAVDDDGCSMFCCVCGDGGSLYVCDDLRCGKSYCFSCVARYTSSTIVQMVKQSIHWKCFLCSEYSPLTHGRLLPQTDWSLQLVKFFQTGHVPLCDDLRYMNTACRRKLRVLSLFDGIGTGKLALDELGLEVDVYYASEVDPAAMLVANYHHSPVQLGDAWHLNTTELKKLCPIDLVLGGPPCNDLSIVNPARKGFNGTGILVLKFVDILKNVEALCKGSNHVFWLLENTGSMLTEYKQVICNMLEMEPAVWDAKHFTGQKRARNFWGNIPGMYSAAQYCRQLEKDKKDLDWALISNCNRKARVSHTRTITTSRNSLSINNGVNNALVSMNGVDDHIWVQEIERLFGFPTHYTDVGNMSHDRRRQLLGKSWSVPVIKHLLSPLRQYFMVKDMSQTTGEH